MNSMRQVKSVLPKWSVLLVLFAATVAASAQKKESAPAPHPSAPAPHAAAPTQHAAAPAQHPAGGSNGARPGTPTGSNNRGPGGTNSNNRGPGGATANKPGGANSHGPAGTNANNRGPGGATANKPGGTNANNRGPGGTNANKPVAANGRGPAVKTNAGARGPGAANNRAPAGSKSVALKSGGNASFRKDGKVRTIQTKGMTINHGVHGERRIVSQHNGRTVVTTGKRGGYSQRAYYSHDGRSYVQRTYYVGGVRYAYAYNSYSYGGYPYYGYAPAYYYGPAYYGWAYNPWPAPVTYGWGWGGAPWYGYYGPYFQPYPVYPTAAFWLADYLIAANLQAAYAAQAEAESGAVISPEIRNATGDEIAALRSTDPLIAANLEATYGPYMLGAAAPAAKGNGPQLSAEVKQAIADQLKREIAAEKDAASGAKKPAGGDQTPEALNPDNRYFVVSSNLDATTSDGVECGLTPGDVIYRTGDKPDDDNMVDATVKSGKKDDCANGVTVGVNASDLQEMHNHLRETMDAGLKTLAEKQGKDGIPAAPDTKTQAGEVPAPAPDTNVDSDLNAQKQDADQAEAEVQQQAPAASTTANKK